MEPFATRLIFIDVEAYEELNAFCQAKENSRIEQVPVPPDALRVCLRTRLSTAFELNVDFALQRGITILFGASGAGKTTLLDCIAGLRTPESGHISISGQILFDSEKRTHAPPTHRKVGYVFQDLALFPHLSVESNVAYGLSDIPAVERKQRVARMLDSMGISSLAHRRPAQLSGGERQRVALARALVTAPSILLLDEPLAALDLPVRMKIADDLRHSIQACQFR